MFFYSVPHEGIVSPEIARAAHMMRASRFKFGNVPDVYVIDKGALKGFVSISPTWSGIDNQAFQDVSRQVYEEDEFEELLHEADILSGKDHSNVISMTLNDYRVAPGVMFMKRSDPQLTLGKRSLKLKGVIRALGKPSHVSLKISDNNDSISVFPCDEDDVMSFRVPAKLFSDHKCVMRINSKRFVHGIMKSNDLDISRTYTLSGEYLQNKNTAVFSLVDGVTLRTIKETD